MSTTVKNSKMVRRYGEDFKRQAVELMIHSGKTQRQVARELDVSEYSLNLWKKSYLGQMKPAQIEGEIKGPEEGLWIRTMGPVSHASFRGDNGRRKKGLRTAEENTS